MEDASLEGKSSSALIRGFEFHSLLGGLRKKLIEGVRVSKASVRAQEL